MENIKLYQIYNYKNKSFKLVIELSNTIGPNGEKYHKLIVTNLHNEEKIYYKEYKLEEKEKTQSKYDILRDIIFAQNDIKKFVDQNKPQIQFLFEELGFTQF